jgi:hypothetical protein
MSLAVGDFEMIEACVVLALAKQWDKVELIRSGKDPYRDMGAAIYKLVPEQCEAFFAALKEALTTEQEEWRAAGKTGVLSCGFAVSGDGLHHKISVAFSRDVQPDRRDLSCKLGVTGSGALVELKKDGACGDPQAR